MSKLKSNSFPGDFWQEAKSVHDYKEGLLDAKEKFFTTSTGRRKKSQIGSSQHTQQFLDNHYLHLK